MRVEKMEVLRVSDDEVAQAVMDFYNLPASCTDLLAMQEWNNYSSYRFNVKREPLDKQGAKYVANFKSGAIDQ